MDTKDIKDLPEDKRFRRAVDDLMPVYSVLEEGVMMKLVREYKLDPVAFLLTLYSSRYNALKRAIDENNDPDSKIAKFVHTVEDK